MRQLLFVGTPYFGAAVFLDRCRIGKRQAPPFNIIILRKVNDIFMNTKIHGMEFTLGHYFIDAPGEQDIYFQLSAAPENFQKAQPLWEEALKTLSVE